MPTVRSQYLSGQVDLTCKDCGGSFPHFVKRGNYPQFCEACRLNRRRLVRRATKHVRRARIRTTAVEYINPQTIYERDGWRCGLCARRINPAHRYPHPHSASLDHIVPLAVGGGHLPANVQVACLTCNRVKAAGGTQQLPLFG